MASPNMAGKLKKAVKRIILRNTRTALPRSSCTDANTGWATWPIALATNELAIESHL